MTQVLCFAMERLVGQRQVRVGLPPCQAAVVGGTPLDRRMPGSTARTVVDAVGELSTIN